MKIRTIFTGVITMLGLICGVSAAALNVESRAGELSQSVNNPGSVTTLNVTGTIDASDIQFINDKMTSLQSLNLSKAKIVAYEGKILSTGAGVAAADEVPAYAFFGTPITSIELPEGITTIGRGALGASAITSISIPATVTSIQSSAFAGCKNLKAIVVPESVKTLGDYTFKDCTALETVDIRGAAESIEPSTFAGCKKLTSVALPQSITSIGAEAFFNCEALKSVSFPASLVTIGERAFYGSGLTDVNLSKSTSMREIGEYAFAMNRSLQSVKLPATATQLGAGLFFEDSALKTIILPEGLTAIPALMFKGNRSLNDSALLPSAVTNIGDYALMGMTSAGEITLPSGLEVIGAGAMEDWTSLKTIYAEELAVVPTLGDDVWAGVDKASAVVFVKADMKEQYENTPQWNGFEIKVNLTGVDSVADDAANPASSISFRFVGDHLVISSAGPDITGIDIYDLSGRLRLSNHEEQSQEVDVALNRLPDSAVLVVNVTLADGSTAPLKVAL